MESFIDFKIQSPAIISAEFTKRGVNTFAEATVFIKQLSYGRNADKLSLKTVFKDNCGTCSTKHALLKQLATENDFKNLTLVMGLFKMNGSNTPKVAERLGLHRLEYIPEAHCYLKYENGIMDFTKPNSSPSDFVDDLIAEVEIEPHQITNFKVDYHKAYLAQWIKENEAVNFNLDELWRIREACIEDLSK